MRLWSLHPKYLDSKGLVSLWRESLLAQKVLLGQTRGYSHHPQLLRFRYIDDPIGAIGAYLNSIYEEAIRRGYTFDASKIIKRGFHSKISVTKGQIDFEFMHLLKKLKERDPKLYNKLRNIRAIDASPLFTIETGEVENWERGYDQDSTPRIDD